jgi:hypothetical protein
MEASRVLSFDIDADLPLVDIALRRAKAASRLGLDAGAATTLRRYDEAEDDAGCGAGAGAAATSGLERAGAERVLSPSLLIAALPPLDIALRLANAAALLLFCCAIAIVFSASSIPNVACHF